MSSTKDFFQRNKKFILGILFMLIMTVVTFKVLFSNVDIDEGFSCALCQKGSRREFEISFEIREDL